MTLRLIEGWDYIPALTSDVDTYFEAGGWYLIQPNSRNSNATIPLTNLPWSTYEGRFESGNSVGMQDQFQQPPGQPLSRWAWAARPLGAFYSEGWFRTAIKIPVENTSDIVMAFMDGGASARMVTVIFKPLGVVQVWRGISTQGWEGDQEFLGGTPAGMFEYDQWFHAEVYNKVGTGNGEVEVRINTETVLSIVSADTQGPDAGTGFDTLVIGAEGWCSSVDEGYNQNHVRAISFRFDDLSFNDDAGTLNNSWIGNCRVRTQFTSAPGDSTDFTVVGAVANYLAAQNRVPSDTIYNHSGTAGDYDLYELQALLNAPYVHGVQSRIMARMDDATQRNLHAVFKTALGTEFEGGDHYINQTYTYYMDIHEINPDTGVEFTGAEVNSLQLGPKVEA